MLKTECQFYEALVISTMLLYFNALWDFVIVKQFYKINYHHLSTAEHRNQSGVSKIPHLWLIKTNFPVTYLIAMIHRFWATDASFGCSGSSLNLPHGPCLNIVCFYVPALLHFMLALRSFTFLILSRRVHHYDHRSTYSCPFLDINLVFLPMWFYT